MGAGKTMVGTEVARLTERSFVDLDSELERRHGMEIPLMFAERGEPWFRNEEAELARQLLEHREPLVLALGGGAVGRPETRRALAEGAFTVLLEIDVEEAWRRVAGTSRPLAQDEETFRRLFEERRPIYREAANAVATDVEGVLLAAGSVSVERGAIARLDSLVPGEGAVALVADEHVLSLHQPSLGARLLSTHTVPAGEMAKSLSVCERLWEELALDRGGTVVALGGGAATDVGGFVAASYLRGIAWVPVPSTIVGMVDAAIGGKTGDRPRQGQEPRRCVPPPGSRRHRPRSARGRCPRSSEPRAWPRS